MIWRLRWPRIWRADGFKLSPSPKAGEDKYLSLKIGRSSTFSFAWTFLFPPDHHEIPENSVSSVLLTLIQR